MNSKTTLMATLGGQPQKVTFLLDLLLARGEEIDQVTVVYISSYGRTLDALKLLEAEFPAGVYRGRPCRLIKSPLRSGTADLLDIRTPAEVEAARQNIHQLLSEYKEENQRIHIGLSGGRRLISMITLSAAMQYLTPVDHLWHINASADILDRSRDGRIMHVPAEAEVYLLPVPFIPWVSYFPGLADLLHRSPQEMGEAAYRWLDGAERDRCQRVWEALTPRQREVLGGFAAGQSRQEVASQFNISVTTVDTHRDHILAQCRLVWNAQTGKEFNVKFLQQYFGPFLAGLKQT
jgi:CRISPR-associated protein Csx14